MNTTIKTGLAAILLLAISCKKETGNLQSSRTVTDLSNVVTGKYPSVLIGTQRWMKKNLDVTHYRNGDKITQVRDPYQWNTTTTGAWCWFNNDSATGVLYGKLYNWYAVHDPRGLAPTGWHVPTDAEWDTLSAYLGGDAKAGGKLKDTGTIEAGTGLWSYPNAAATNKTGFTGLPGGDRFNTGTFSNINRFGFWWTSTQERTAFAWYRYLAYGWGDIKRWDPLESTCRHASLSIL